MVQQLSIRKARQTLAEKQTPTKNSRRQQYWGLGAVGAAVATTTAHLAIKQVHSTAATDGERLHAVTVDARIMIKGLIEGLE